MHTETKSLADPTGWEGRCSKFGRLKTLKPGDATLSLDYLRPWEGRAKAVKHFQVNVHIQ